MSQVIRKFITNDAVDGTKIHLDNAQPIRARNAANSADIDLIALDPSNQAVISAALSVGGAISGTNLSGTNSGDVTLAAVGVVPNANGASLSGQVLTLQPFDSTHPGVVTASGGGTTNFLRADGTWAAPSSSGANQSLSNLTNPTAINQDLIFNTGAAAALKTKNDAAATKDLSIETGTPSVIDVNSGELSLLSGNATGTGQSGNVILSSGSTVNVASGSVTISSGPPTGGANSGIVSIVSGDATATSGASGNVSLASGASDIASGTVSIASGTSASADTGAVSITSGNSSGGNSGDINLSIGTATATRGKIKFIDGSEGTIGNVWTSAGTGGEGTWAALTATVTSVKQLSTLTGTDITNQYIDLAFVAQTDSISFVVKGGGIQIEESGGTQDYTVDYTGGAGGNTRINFTNDLATGGVSALVAGDVVAIQYLK